MRINRKIFFDLIRRNPFGGQLAAWQVDGLTRILDYWAANWPKMSIFELAYLLATIFHETAATMQPISERGSYAYLRTKAYWPWIGRGLIQLTWADNYRRFGITRPEDAQAWPTALDIAFRGMILGLFTGKKLADYIKPSQDPDYYKARKIINKLDDAALIAGYARKFEAALSMAREAA